MGKGGVDGKGGFDKGAGEKGGKGKGDCDDYIYIGGKDGKGRLVAPPIPPCCDDDSDYDVWVEVDPDTTDTIYPKGKYGGKDGKGKDKGKDLKGKGKYGGKGKDKGKDLKGKGKDKGKDLKGKGCCKRRRSDSSDSPMGSNSPMVDSDDL